MKECVFHTEIIPQKVCAYTMPSGPRGVGIKSISQRGNNIIITYDDGQQNQIAFPDWWFGTRAEYQNLSPQEKNKYYLHFIEEDS